MRKAWITSSLGTCTAVLIAAGLIAAGPAFAADSTYTVDQDAEHGWLFNRDASTSTPYEFTSDQASTGRGSLYVLPITNTDADGDPEPKDKFVGEQFAGTPVTDLESIAYDFLISGPSGDSSDADDFYLNVYTLMEGSPSTYYDCRFDYVPATGSTAEFTTALFGAAEAPALVKSRSGVDCPDTLAEMPGGSTINFFSINVGDTSANDTGLAGYFDNVVVTQSDGSTTYDFEHNPTMKNECKNGGYASFGFKNQGECIAWLNSPKG